MTWAGERSKHFCSFQLPGLFFLLTLPFIERGNRTSSFFQLSGKDRPFRYISHEVAARCDESSLFREREIWKR
jgi:hypothetical protein